MAMMPGPAVSPRAPDDYQPKSEETPGGPSAGSTPGSDPGPNTPPMGGGTSTNPSGTGSGTGGPNPGEASGPGPGGPFPQGPAPDQPEEAMVPPGHTEHNNYHPYTPATATHTTSKPNGGDPFLHPFAYLIYLVLLIGVAVVGSLVMGGSWAREKAQVQDRVLNHLGLESTEENLDRVLDRLLALVPCTPRQLRGSLSRLDATGRVWLCFLAEKLLVVAPRTDEILTLAYRDLQELHLVDRRTGEGHPFSISTPGGKSRLELSRLDDVVRIINIFIQQDIVLRYEKE